ncbi:MAG: translation initiation factor [Planctomycetes bacterium]|nr:translation initiation factor [Planctomycetota bacterium]
MSGLFAGTSLERPVTCERCGKTHAQCGCPRDRASGKVLDPKDQQIRIRREQRRGKFTTVIAGFAPRSDRSDDLPAILKQLKAKFATGGTIDTTDAAAPTLELQGDHRDKVVEYFKGLGYPAKPAGG